MKPIPFLVRLETPEDDPVIDTLHEEAFGPGRFARTAFRLREGIAHDPRLSFVGMSGGQVAGSVRLTPIAIGSAKALLLGPLAVSPRFKNKGIGRALVRTALQAAKELGEAYVLLVGDAPYYGPLGFEQVAFGSITLPGPVDPARVLVAPLAGGQMPEGPAQARSRS
ncbi:GNAT family N-acetyltransferase [Stappia sp. GBMRC 2046]|uniref:GNAT family N-acetyltransferase n=1 Tax=Stappia sediminis TaxID=2692190 RepID=A0A7X3LQM7_9HYPH|nr:N-acetyltransferase [Stappia sediminis]MXN63303.1 GNAT family N-acetyltransferase [Stappia sediminis]